MDKLDITKKANYLNDLNDHIPNGLSSLKDSVSFAELDLRISVRMGCYSKGFAKSMIFVSSIPVFSDFESDECAHWMLNDVEHLKYF